MADSHQVWHGQSLGERKHESGFRNGSLKKPERASKDVERGDDEEEEEEVFSPCAST